MLLSQFNFNLIQIMYILKIISSIFNYYNIFFLKIILYWFTIQRVSYSWFKKFKMILKFPKCFYSQASSLMCPSKPFKIHFIISFNNNYLLLMIFWFIFIKNFLKWMYIFLQFRYQFVEIFWIVNVNTLSNFIEIIITNECIRITNISNNSFQHI